MQPVYSCDGARQYDVYTSTFLFQKQHCLQRNDVVENWRLNLEAVENNAYLWCLYRGLTIYHIPQAEITFYNTSTFIRSFNSV